MSKDFKNFKSLFNHINKEMAKSMNTAGEVGKEAVKTQMDKDVYSYKPEEYKRTYELRDSISHDTQVKNNKVVTKIYHDISKINSYEDGYKHYSADPSYTPKDVSDWMPYLINKGKSGSYFGEGFWTIPRPYVSNAKEQMKKNKLHINVLKNDLKKKGFNIE